LILEIGDSIFSSNSIIEVNRLQEVTDRDSLKLKEDDIGIALQISAKTLKGVEYKAKPVMVVRGNRLFSLDDEIPELGLKFSFKNIDPENQKITILLYEKNKNAGDFIIMQAIVFPYINLLWLGCVIMIIGTFIAIINRIRKPKTTDSL